MWVVDKGRAAARVLSRPLIQSIESAKWSGLYGRPHEPLTLDAHILEAARWLIRAQDAGDNRGVSYGTRFGQSFDESYPETTGYIICTFVDLCDYFGEQQYLDRAIEMGDWEINVQMKSGAVMGGKLNHHPTPAIFNTGQVLLGWASLAERTGEERFREAGRRAANWMMEMQESDGNWIKGNSDYAEAQDTVYNVKAAWGLAAMGQALDDSRMVEAAVRNGEYAIKQQRPNGWFAHCCLTDASRPLLHTIAYTMQGLMGIGKIAQRRDMIEAAQRTADALKSIMTPDGFLPGRYDESFRGTVPWACMTGTAQTSIVWSELGEITGDESYFEAAKRANRYLMARHDVSNADPALRGGIPGSWPVSGDYGRFQILNWATKFFIDALLLEKKATPA